ncbi:hypothetical protein O6H91_18G060300 [Diphasiastrum complanatum]|uniref:Uncharacterized protein n=1 Tax=Diphasiastrum complanatum TaxID=34168 RepID=A0ACC2B1S8_DIPCM|nr:hypothetical protein O6H91_18G060300 [Diphasiastrum complanatum]
MMIIIPKKDNYDEEFACWVLLLLAQVMHMPLVLQNSSHLQISLDKLIHRGHCGGLFYHNSLAWTKVVKRIHNIVFSQAPQSTGLSRKMEDNVGAETLVEVLDEKQRKKKPRTAIITGVARPTGIGRTLVYRYLEKGYQVIGSDLRELDDGDQQKTSSVMSAKKLPLDRFHFVQADIQDPSQAKRIVEEAVHHFGNHIHVLVNNAARANANLDMDRIKSFADTIATNLNGAFYLSECVIPYMPPGESSIIHISSTRALQSEPFTEGYSAAKAGLCGLTHSQAITLAGKVRVNAVLPGWINTNPLGKSALRPEDHQWHPVGRVGVPNDVALLCLFLSDEECSGFITGQQFVVDGGATKKMVYPE